MPSDRRDAVRNRERLIFSARKLLTTQGLNVPLEEVAQLAGVSRTTLRRHFSSREELIATVFADNVAKIERRCLEAINSDTGIVEVFHFILDMQFRTPVLAHALTQETESRFREFAHRVASALAPLVLRGTETNIVRPGVTVQHVMLALPMAFAAFQDDENTGLAKQANEVRSILHHGLFLDAAGDPPTEGS